MATFKDIKVDVTAIDNNVQNGSIGLCTPRSHAPDHFYPGVITFNRPTRGNAITPSMGNEIVQAVQQLQQDVQVCNCHNVYTRVRLCKVIRHVFINKAHEHVLTYT
jgi:hypothetical protein